MASNDQNNRGPNDPGQRRDASANDASAHDGQANGGREAGKADPARSPKGGAAPTATRFDTKRIDAAGGIVMQGTFHFASLAGFVRAVRDELGPDDGLKDEELKPDDAGDPSGPAAGFAAAVQDRPADPVLTDTDDRRAQAAKLPATEEQITQWYCRVLTADERRFVQAVAVLQGAPMYAASRAAEDLQPEESGASRRHDRQGRSEQDRAGAQQLTSTHTLLEHTHTMRRQIAGASRVYWSDAESSGYSAFGAKVLRFLAEEAQGMGALPGADLLRQIERWATAGNAETSWRAARALGMIWWVIDQTQLRQTGARWASGVSREHQAAASLLYGAYEMARTPADGASEGSANDGSAVIRILRQWSDEALDSPEGVRAASVVTGAYSLIGRKWPDVALDGLDYLLELTEAQRKRPYAALPVSVFVFVPISYVTLAWSGQLRAVLGRLASHVAALEHLSDQHAQNAQHAQMSALREARQRRDEGLNALFFTFFFLAASAMSSEAEGAQAQYSRDFRLAAHPVIPDREGRDLLLAAILSQGENEVRDQISAILATAICRGRAELVFDLLREWATDVLTQDADDTHHLRGAYEDFMVELAQRVKRGDTEGQRAGPALGFTAFGFRLGLWSASGRAHGEPIGALADAVKRRIA